MRWSVLSDRQPVLCRRTGQRSDWVSLSSAVVTLTGALPAAALDAELPHCRLRTRQEYVNLTLEIIEVFRVAVLILG